MIRSRRASTENELEAMEEGLDFALSSEDEDEENQQTPTDRRLRHPSTRNKDRSERASFEHLPDIPDNLLAAINESGDATPTKRDEAATAEAA